MTAPPNNNYLLENPTQSLVNFFADSTAIGLSEFYKAQHECTLARYALRDKVTVYSTLRDFLQKQATSNPKEAFLLLGKLDIAADKMIQTVEKVVTLLKKAAEIDILTSTRFDGIQLYYIVQQIPTIIVTLITSILETQCVLFCDSITEDEEVRKRVREHIPVFAASVAKEIAERLAEELQSKLKVLNNTVDAVNPAAKPVEEDRVAGMLETVPLATGD
jgi:hypothetical protein